MHRLLAALPDRDLLIGDALDVTVDTPFHKVQPCSGMWSGCVGVGPRRLV